MYECADSATSFQVSDTTTTNAFAHDAAGLPEPAQNDTATTIARKRRINPIVLTLITAMTISAGYAGYQRLGTNANADVVEFTQNLAGGFLAVGMAEDQPGFVVFSAMDQDEAKVGAVQTQNLLGGTHTVVHVRTPRGETQIRLRGPRVILISKLGDVASYAVDWTVEDFGVLRREADCSTHEAAMKKHHCGQPFSDLLGTFAKWPGERVPDPLRAFLKPFGESGEVKAEDD